MSLPAWSLDQSRFGLLQGLSLQGYNHVFRTFGKGIDNHHSTEMIGHYIEFIYFY